jgi:NAD(P)-dependent dehydrogenase (short-subunit alcohol dehydrogenase family)
MAAAKLFASEGAKVGIVDLPTSDGKQVARNIEDSGGSALFCAADVSDSAQVHDAVREIENTFGVITVLMNHAGTLAVGPLLGTTEE